jgi:hypothetical protein
MIGVLSFLFYPDLIRPIKEAEIHQGRKRVDIRYTNAATHGIFKRVLEANQTRALHVPVECKNYTKEVRNPELDQMAGRFGHTRGFFGIVCCREIDDRSRLVARCRDAALDGRGYIVVLDDADVGEMLKEIGRNARSRVREIMEAKFDELLT